MRRARILEEYNKELVSFASEKERDWAAAAPRLFGPNFLKEAADHLQTLQMVRKIKQQQNFRQHPPSGPAKGGKGPYRPMPYSRPTGQKIYPSGKRAPLKKK